MWLPEGTESWHLPGHRGSHSFRNSSKLSQSAVTEGTLKAAFSCHALKTLMWLKQYRLRQKMNFCYGSLQWILLYIFLKVLFWSSLALEGLCSEDTVLLFYCRAREPWWFLLDVGPGRQRQGWEASLSRGCCPQRGLSSVHSPFCRASAPGWPGHQGLGLRHCRWLAQLLSHVKPRCAAPKARCKGRALRFLIPAHKIWSMPPPCACALGYSSRGVLSCCGSVSLISFLAQEWVTSSGAELGFCTPCGCWSWLRCWRTGKASVTVEL